jgi:membrane fusion protein (multidrug efflux system)
MSSNSERPRAGAAAAAAEKKVRKGPRVLGRIVLVVAVVAGLCYGALWWLDSLAYVSTDDAAIDGRQVKLSSKMLGRISELKAAEGDKVKAGQTLVTLEDTDLKAQETQAVASLAYARQNLEVAKIGLDKSQEDYDRTAKLYSGDATTKEDYEHAQRALDTAKAQFSLAQASVDTAQAQLGVIEAQLLNVRIDSPIDGTVDKVTLNAGDLAQPGQTILSVNNLDSIWITANYEETKVGRIRPGARVLVSVDAYPDRAFEGKVELIHAGAQPSAFQVGDFTKTTQRVPVKIDLSSPLDGATLVPGMSVEVKVRTDAVLPAFAEKIHL